MKPKLFLTGGSGCVGHYLVEELVRDYDLHLLVRNPSKFLYDVEALGAHIVIGDLEDIGKHSDLLATMDYAVLVATAWGSQGMRINVEKTHELLGYLDPEQIRRVVYFSTASILGRDMKPLKQADEFGTDYVKSKYRCFISLPESPLYDRIVTVFPTMVFGGDSTHPISHVSSGLPWIKRLGWLLGRLDVKAGFHYIHAADIASMVHWILAAEALGREYVLGNGAISLGGFLKELSTALGVRTNWQMGVSVPRLYRIAKSLGAKMSDWDVFCAEYKDFVYDATSCSTLGLPSQRATPAQLALDADVIAEVLKKGKAVR